jgi:ubiquinone/menaquinone biosynthesis C-methylase UbiE/uncharacterized protein YbaR (Trm112 family)
MSTAHSSLAQVTRCPACRGAALMAGGTSWECPSCRASYPVTLGIPWLFNEPTRVLAEWRNRLAHYFGELALEQRIAESDLAAAARASTRERLSLLARAAREQQELVASLLSPLQPGLGSTPEATQLAFATPLPRNQTLHGYYPNLHRDWAWGEEENARSLELVARACGTLEGRRLLVLGAGAGRLSYDVHESCGPALTVALDINPMLLFAARRMFAGERVDLYEFPLAPRESADVAVRRVLCAPRPARPGIECVFADALDAPFAAESFDAVLTPWLIDIIDEDFARLAARINRLLPVGGRWVSFGSLSFAQRRPALRYGPQEVRELIEDAGFAVASLETARIPYMQSPASRHGRLEGVLTIASDKSRSVPTPTESAPRTAFDPSLPVPLGERMQQVALATRIQAFVLSLIDGRRSAADIARNLAERKVLPPDQALAAVRALIEQIRQ